MYLRAKYLGVAGVLLAGVVLNGCKQPLGIVGEGDILEVGNTGRGCTLEQFRAGDGACTENEVTGDYSVNYQAAPRQGWRFVRWDGPCPPESDFQHCRFDIKEEGVAWWNGTYPDSKPPRPPGRAGLVAAAIRPL